MAKQCWKPGALLAPVPAVLVSCGEGERSNLLTVAWTGTVCTKPAMTYISVRPERHSYPLIRERGEFAINLVSRPLLRACDWCGVRSGRDGDKFAAAGLTRAPASKIAAPLVAESPVNLECRVTQVLELGSHHMFLAEIVAVDVEESLLDGSGKLCLDRAELIHYTHGEYFAQGEKLGSFGYTVRGPGRKKTQRFVPPSAGK